MPAQALSGLRVVDLSMWWAGPFCTQLLGDLGAEVIKIESIQVLDGWRGGGALPQWWERSPVFSGANRNKQGITLDLRHPRGVELFLQLVATGDVVVENYTPRVMDGFGLPFDRLRTFKPDLIMVSLPAYGGTGPWRDYPGFAFPVEEMAGFPQLTGYADDGVPRRWGNAAADSIAGLNGAYAVLAALEHRRRTGQGQHIDLSQVEALTCFLGEPILDYQVNHRLPRRMGNRDATHAPQGVYPCAGDDRWIAISVTDEAQWQSLCTCISRTEWLTDPRFATLDARHRHHDDLDVGITDWSCERDRLDAMRALQAASVPAMPVMASYELLEDEHLRARDYFRQAPREVVGQQTHGVAWAHFSETPLTLRRPAPLLGEHNETVLSNLLGRSATEQEQLASIRVTGNEPVAGPRT